MFKIFRQYYFCNLKGDKKMKYYKTSNFTKAITSTGFVAVVACALIAVGALAWFVFSRDNNTTTTPSENSSLEQEYPSVDNSYNNDVEIQENVDDTTDVNDTVSDVPYEDEESKTESEVVVEEPTYVLPVTGNISKGYSDTALQYSVTYGDMRLHTGVDILCDTGSNVKSAADGTVKSIVDDANFGKVITIEYQGGITVKYCGMDKIHFSEGDVVLAGEVIGTTGNIPCECADNPHIHIEVYVNGKSVSPLEALGFE